MRVGIVSSSGGSALIAAIQCLTVAGYKLEPVIVADRECGVADWAINQKLPMFQLSYDTPENFSLAALKIFQQYKCSNVLLFYTRRVSTPLIDNLKVWNIHPGLLPAFVGLHAVQQALLAQVSLLGATLHHVDDGLDTGLIVAQVAAPLPLGISRQRAHRLSYIQKVWLTLVWFEQVSGNVKLLPAVQSVGAGIALSSTDLSDEKLKEAFLDWLRTLEPVCSVGSH